MFRTSIEIALARWQTLGKDFLVLYKYADSLGYGYTGFNCGGNLGVYADTDEEAIAKFEASRVAVLKADKPSCRRII